MKYSSTLFSISRPISCKRKSMPPENRAAQFAPFAALTGYDEEIKEVCRFTETCLSPGEDLQAELEQKLNLLHEREAEQPYAEILYFRPDRAKAGGAFFTASGAVLQVDPLEKKVIFTDGNEIFISQIYHIESTVFPNFMP